MTVPDTHPQTHRDAGRQTLVIGLTGGIGSGKSTVAGEFSKLGVPVLDTDQLARELVIPGQPALQEIVTHFGPRALLDDGTLDRAYLRTRIFSDSTDKQALEAILHPRIRQRVREWLATITSPYCIVMIPLLLETQQSDLVDRILVVDAPEKEQLKRVAARDGLSHNVVAGIMAAQIDRESRLSAADDIIVNDAGVDALIERTRKLHMHFMDISNEH
ncbi:MAG: dephospho-CoA kinase [Gammaproteobacteria bacterium]